MYSPYDAVYGHDTTYIQRMTVEEYMRELEEEEADVRGQSPALRQANKQQDRDVRTTLASATLHLTQKRGTRQYEQRRTALSSRNPNVVFSSKYPMYDRLGRELCVAYQIQDTAVQQELRRLEAEEGRGERDSRRSGVRLSAELLIGSDGTYTRPGSLTETQPPSTAEGRESAFSEEASQLMRSNHINSCDGLVDIQVSDTSHYPSVSVSRTSPRPVSARPSEFSIFRESGPVVQRGGVSKAHSNIPVRTIAEEDRILIHREATGGGVDGGGLPLRATSLPTTAPAAHDSDDQRLECRRKSEKRRRSRSSGGRLSRIRFISEERDESAKPTTNPQEQQQQQQPRRAPGAAAPLPRRLTTPPPNPLSDPDQSRNVDAVTVEATRWTTLSRGSAAVRATKQLFRSTMHSTNASRMTSTLTYTQPIPSNVYGLAVPAIAASKVRDAVEQNVVACTAAMPQQYTQGFDTAVSSSSNEYRRHTPELQCGSVVQLGAEWYRLVHFHVVAEVYEAVRVSTTVASAGSQQSLSCRNAEWGGRRDTEKQNTANMIVSEKSSEAEKREGIMPHRREDEHAKAATSALATFTSHEKEPLIFSATKTVPSSSTALRQQQVFIYRWRASNLSHGVNEARRAALGLSLCATQAHVTGFDYADGGGITVVTLPAGFHAVPVSALPLSLRSYTTLLRIMLKALSTMVARRTVHGNVAALGDMFLVLPVEDTAAVRTPGGAESPRQDNTAGFFAAAHEASEARSREPFIILFHWEHWVDFGMYIDRNAGRTLPFDFEDSATPSIVYYSKDLLTVLQLFLEHTLAAELTSEQYILLQKLIMLAAEPTPVANHLIQLKNLMLTLPTDTAALQGSFKAALAHYAEA